MKLFNKKGMSLGDLPSVALSFVLVGVFFGVGLLILASLQTNATIAANSAANAAVAKSITALSEIPNNWLGLIALVIAAAIVIGVVVGQLGKSGR
jgi:hypothetical protein